MKKFLQQLPAIVITFVVGIALLCLISGVKLTGGNFKAVSFAVIGALFLVFAFVAVVAWAAKAKDEHEAKVKDGSLEYRASQVKYAVACVILGFVLILFILTVMNKCNTEV
jgi:cytochrome bd-type quinol oxidase subunit 2